MSENLSLKRQIFSALAKEVSPQAILASNTSSISITKIAASTVPKDVSAASEKGKANASRVVGACIKDRGNDECEVYMQAGVLRPPFLQSSASDGQMSLVF